MSKSIDLNVMKFGSLTILNRASSDNRGESMWLCKCECGKESTVRSSALRKGIQVSCGCVGRKNSAEAKITHGMSNEKIYRVWSQMIQRCENEKTKGYKNYGGRGISVCERWKSFQLFILDMGKRPSSIYTIDRIDSNGNYEPNNCRWATQKEQQRNRRNNTLVSVQGKEIALAEAVEALGIKKHQIGNLMSKKKYSAQQAVNEFMH